MFILSSREVITTNDYEYSRTPLVIAMLTLSLPQAWIQTELSRGGFIVTIAAISESTELLVGSYFKTLAIGFK